MINSKDSETKLSPEFRERLLQESKRPFAVIRRSLWVILFGSAGVGLLIMSFRGLSGTTVPLGDSLIQVSAVAIFGCLLWMDR